jgi:hypothetical protein
MAAAVFAIAAPALGAGVKPKTGDYEATPQGSSAGGLGVFRVVEIDGKFHMVVDPQYSQIYYPDAGKCHSFDIGVSGTDYPISSKGKFHIEDSRPADGHDIDVDWKGHWTSKSKLAGSIKISYKNCTDKRDFTGRKATFSR